MKTVTRARDAAVQTLSPANATASNAGSRKTVLGARRILACLGYGIGDVVMQFPVLHALRQAVPSASITAIGAEPATELLDGAGVVDATVVYGSWGIRHLWDNGAARTRSQVEAWLKEAAFDLALNMDQSPPPVLEAVRRVGLPKLEKDEAEQARALAAGANASEALARATYSGWGLPPEPASRPAIELFASEVEFARELLTRCGVSAPPVGFCPLASSNLKRWPESRFAAVADWAAANTGRDVVLFGGDVDDTTAAMQRLMCCVPRAVVGRMPLRRIAAILSRCAALVTNDTGLMHIAAAVGTPVVAIFGPTSPSLFLPRGRTIALGGEVNCPYRATGLTPPGCWHSATCLIGPGNCTVTVETEDVIAALAKMLPARLATEDTRLTTATLRSRV